MPFDLQRVLPIFLYGALVALLCASCDGGTDSKKETNSGDPPASEVAEAGGNPEVPPGKGDFTFGPTKEKPITPLHRAASKGNVPLARALLEEKNDPNIQLEGGLAPIHVATGEGHKDIVALLLEKGADPNIQQAAGGTALHIAIHTNQPEVIDLLLERKADPDLKDNEGIAPLHWVVASKNLDSAGRIAIAEKLLAAGANIDVQAKNGSTPLHAACQSQLVELAAFLLEKGASTEIKGPANNTPLHFAAEKQDLELCKLLVEHGADMEAVNDDKVTPVQIAMKKGMESENAALVEFFQTHGAKIPK